MEDNAIIDLFFERSEKAIAELSEKYGKLCMKISYNILGNREDSEECVNDSYLSVWNAVPPERPALLSAFLLKIVRNISLNRYDYNTRKKRNSEYDECLHELEWCLSSSASPEDEMNADALLQAINDFLSTLDETTQMLFVRRFWYVDSYRDFAEKTGINEGAIRTKLSRTKMSLMQFLKERGVFE